jgi:hypothetical protein
MNASASSVDQTVISAFSTCGSFTPSLGSCRMRRCSTAAAWALASTENMLPDRGGAPACGDEIVDEPANVVVVQPLQRHLAERRDDVEPDVALVAEPRGRLQLQPLLGDPAGEELPDGDLGVLDHAAVPAPDHLVQRCGRLSAGGEPVLAHLTALAVHRWQVDPERPPAVLGALPDGASSFAHTGSSGMTPRMARCSAGR